MGNYCDEKRLRDRYPFLVTIGYQCEGDCSRSIFSGMSVNMSRAGMCLYLFESPCLREGANISLAGETLMTSRRGTIRWMHKVEDGFYKVGLQFI
ncbi:MAG: PilZ domain-containing protein [Nitrospiraceae bacterium]|nr:PilZ domain-containing protein [Nitrospiraceae bacterium]